MSATTELPVIGTPMYLVLGEHVNFRSRLESIDTETFTVAAPLETTGHTAITSGHELDVFWAPPRTRIVLPCKLIAISGEAPYRWTLAPTQAPRQSNRREFVRGGGGAAVRLATGKRDIDGALLDISEGGLRCWIDEPARLSPGDQLTAMVVLGEYGEVELTGTVLTVRDAPHGDPGQHIVLTFDTQESMAKMIRLYVRSWEINERRLANNPDA
ncbi:PilZ domain-containing protein [Actinoplanes sp. KI2]|uniref:PilZ domain-containing protein n=1 Tax=Actinoplanes sp. KI2 TaxID=2983315 RepID=UPI0021D5E9AE|nr:PilZ domain-containing protein [Actinoplanes sp. KI2]MCU7724964.1 PilZ domain-containing protein [Actinoplanes sp. KI2]